MYDAVNHGWLEPRRLRRLLASTPLRRAADGRIVFAVDVSNWLRPDAPTSPELLFCLVYGRGRSADQFIPGWPYSFVAALETGRTSWTAVLDAIRLGPSDDATAVTATQLREVATRLVNAGQWRPGDADILVVMDTGYDVTRLAYVLAAKALRRIVQDCVTRQILVLANRAYQGAGATVRTPYYGHRELPEHYQQCNRDHARLRTPGERAFARLKSWRLLRQARCSTNRIGRMVAAVHALLACEYAG
jgi:hypothetical protein